MKPLLTRIEVNFCEDGRILIDFHRLGMPGKITHLRSPFHGDESVKRLARVCAELAADKRGWTIPYAWGWAWIPFVGGEERSEG